LAELSDTTFKAPSAVRPQRHLSIPDVVARHAARTPDKPYLIIETESGAHITTFGVLFERATLYAKLLVQRGVRPQDTVALLFTTDPALAPVLLGTMIAGAIPFMLPSISARQDPARFWEAQFATLERTAPRLIVTDGETAALMAAQTAAGHAFRHDNVIDITSVSLDALPALPPRPPAGPRDIAFLQHSSGTTGAKKGVMLTHQMVTDAVAALATALAITESDIIASWLPLYHDMGLIACMVLPMLLGLTTVHINPFDWVVRPTTLFDVIERHRATLCWQPNFALAHLTRLAPRGRHWNLTSMRAFINCSESCKPETVAAFVQRFADSGVRAETMQVSYAMAENVFGVTQTDPASIPRVLLADAQEFHRQRISPPSDPSNAVALLSTGRPIPGTRVEIRNPEGEPVAERQIGEILVDSTYLFTGYFGAGAPAGKFAGPWYRTGDFGFLDAGELFVCGRRDELLIINGRNIYAPDVEFAVNRGTQVKPGRCVAIGPYNARAGSQSLILIAETEDATPAGQQALARTIQALINSEFGVQTHHVMVTSPGWIIKTTSGKLARGANEARYVKEHWQTPQPA